ncbi:hypothetical protein ACNKU7_07955 [Microbulbifer sp. SA54]|uniref:hypothetical protein n=1 Tax=Microbulbifer sp. SA54 TaxID=3401577 RepID=UPI003AAAB273
MKKEFFLSFTLLAVSDQGFAKDQFGVSMGNPGGINFVAKKEISGLPLQFAIGYAGAVYGVEGGYQFFRRDSGAIRSIQFVAGATRADEVFDFYRDSEDEYDLSWEYIGISSTIQYGGFFVEPGISATNGEFSDSLMSLQVGWLWD